MQPLGNQANAAPKLHFKAPEGRYELVGERLSGLCAFSASRAPRLTLAELPGGEEAGAYLVFSIQDALNICRFTESAKVSCMPCSAGQWPARPPCAARTACVRAATVGPRQVPLSSISFGAGATAGTAVLPTSHAYIPAADGLDLLVGLSTGDGEPPRLLRPALAAPTPARRARADSQP